MPVTTNVQCPVRRREGEPIHTQRVVGFAPAIESFVLECNVCGAAEVPRRSEVFRSVGAFVRGDYPIDVFRGARP